MVRSSVALVLAIVMLFAGFHALSLQSQSVEPDFQNDSNTTTDTYNLTNAVYEGAGRTLSTSLTWMGVAALVAGAGGLLLITGGKGR